MCDMGIIVEVLRPFRGADLNEHNIRLTEYNGDNNTLGHTFAKTVSVMRLLASFIVLNEVFNSIEW